LEPELFLLFFHLLWRPWKIAWRKEVNMAKIRKRTNKKGVTWQIDYYDPECNRVMKCFPLKKDAEAYLGKVQAAKREGRYHDVFDVKKETQFTFDDLADRYVENYRCQKCFSRLKYYLVDEYRAVFGE
jgi:hypothetical protein